MKPFLALMVTLAASCLMSGAEVEYELHTEFRHEIICRWPDLGMTKPKVENLGLPVLITVCDEDHVPISGAYVALKRIGPEGGYQESDIVSPESARSDKNGNAVILHPRWRSFGAGKIVCESKDPNDDPPYLKLVGAVTVVAEGYVTQSLELEQATEAAKLPDQAAVVPRFTVVLRKKKPGVEK